MNQEKTVSPEKSGAYSAIRLPNFTARQFNAHACINTSSYPAEWVPPYGGMTGLEVGWGYLVHMGHGQHGRPYALCSPLTGTGRTIGIPTRAR